MDWTRRQFGLWAGAALLAADAWAAEPVQQAVIPDPKATPDPKPEAEPLVLDGVWASATDTEVTWTLRARHGEREGVALRWMVAAVRVVDGTTSTGVMAWSGDNHPWSRRLLAPDMVDVPPGRLVAIGELHAMVPAPLRTATARLHAEIQVWRGEDSRMFPLPPMPVLNPDRMG